MRGHLLLLVLVALLPMLVWATGLTVWNSVNERRAIERGLVETVQALSLAVDQNLSLSIEALNSIALSQTLIVRDYAMFQRIAEKAVLNHPQWVNVVLSAPDGRQIVNTGVPYGSPLPEIQYTGYQPLLRMHRIVMESGAPIVSDLFVNSVTGRLVVAVTVPVFDDEGNITHTLSARLHPEAMGKLMQAQALPDAWLAAVIDGQMQIVARSLDHDSYMGGRAMDWFAEAVEGRQIGIASGPSLDGRDTIFAFARSERSDWIIAFGAPQAEFLTTLYRNLALTTAFGLGMLAVSLVLGLWVARRILRPVEALSRTAHPFVRTHKPAAGGAYAVTELDELHRALDGLSAALEESEARFSRMFATAPVMLDVLDPSGRVAEVNQRWLSTLGYERNEVIGRHFWEFLSPDSRAYAEHVVFPETLRGNGVEDLPLRFMTREGDMREVMLSSEVEFARDGTVRRVVSALRDVTEQRRVEAALGRAIEEAEKANDTKSRFLAAASHDLRQPLQALTLYLGVLASRVGDTEKPVMDAVGQCVESLSGLLHDMLDVARLDAGIVQPRAVDVSIGEIVSRVATSWRIQAASKNVRLDAVACDRAMVRTDPALIERVLSNLVANAVRYTDHGRVLVGCRHAGDGRLRIEVWDTGIGIPHDKLSEIFEEFRQLGNPERGRDKGTGLGLAIVDRIARLLGHEITVRSEVGKGSMFAITLPTAEATASVAAMEVADRPGNETGRHILVVEDEIHVRKALELVLTEMGYSVDVAEGLNQAVDHLHKFCPNLVIADYRLAAGVTGLDVIRALRAQCGSQLPAVVLTGDTDPAVIRRIVGEGMHLLHKPLQVEALQGFLKQVA